MLRLSILSVYHSRLLKYGAASINALYISLQVGRSHLDYHLLLVRGMRQLRTIVQGLSY
jgi:hypothetical protein